VSVLNSAAKPGTSTKSLVERAPGEPSGVPDDADAVVTSADEEMKDDDTDHIASASPRTSKKRGRQLSISLRSFLVVLVVMCLAVATAAMTWLYLGQRSKAEAAFQQTENDRHAEQVAMDYAVNAAVMDYHDLGPWKQNLVKGTTPELTDKLTKAAKEMEQILLPMQWASTAKPLAAKVHSRDNGLYVVDAFVSVMTKTVQAGDGLQSTATYSVTIDPKNAWHITDVGGIASMVN
jgi:Mce-associated membrane protein